MTTDWACFCQRKVDQGRGETEVRFEVRIDTNRSYKTLQASTQDKKNEFKNKIECCDTPVKFKHQYHVLLSWKP